MVLKINANTVVDTRKGSVVIESNYKGDKLTCSITQTGVDMQTNVAPLDINVGSGFTSTIPVALTANYNCDWTVENTIYWLDAEIVNDKTQAALCNITVNEKNPLSTERRGKVLLYDDIGNEYIVWVIQEKGAITSSLSTQYIEIPKVGGEETITLTANFNATWELVDKSEWCYATFNGNGTPNGSVKIVVIPNDRQNQREGFVKIKNNEIKLLVSILACLVICTAGLNTLGTFLVYGVGKKTYLAYLGARLPVQCIMAAVNFVIIGILLRVKPLTKALTLKK